MKKHQHTNQLSQVANNVSNAGRTLLDLLGALAISGVLSLIMLTGYKILINSHKANELLEDVRLYATAIVTNDYDVSTSEFIPNTSYAFDAEILPEEPPLLAINTYFIEGGVCKQAYSKAEKKYTIKINGILDGDCDAVEVNSENTPDMTFIFDAKNFSENVCINVETKKDCRIKETERNEYGCSIKEPIACLDDEYCGEDDGLCKTCPADMTLNENKTGCLCVDGYDIEKKRCCTGEERFIDVNEYDELNEGYCCVDANSSEECCFALNIKDVYNTETMYTIGRFLQYSDGICQCAPGLVERTTDQFCVECNSDSDCEECLFCSETNECSGTKEFKIESINSAYAESLNQNQQYKRIKLFDVYASSNCAYEISLKAYIDDTFYFESQKGYSCYEGNYSERPGYHHHCTSGKLYNVMPGDVVSVYAQDLHAQFLAFGGEYTTEKQRSSATLTLKQIENVEEVQYGCTTPSSGEYCITYNSCACGSDVSSCSCENSSWGE